jgi:hypothetical protein
MEMTKDGIKPLKKSGFYLLFLGIFRLLCGIIFVKAGWPADDV